MTKYLSFFQISLLFVPIFGELLYLDRLIETCKIPQEFQNTCIQGDIEILMYEEESLAGASYPSPQIFNYIHQNQKSSKLFLKKCTTQKPICCVAYDQLKRSENRTTVIKFGCCGSHVKKYCGESEKLKKENLKDWNSNHVRCESNAKTQIFMDSDSCQLHNDTQYLLEAKLNFPLFPFNNNTQEIPFYHVDQQFVTDSYNNDNEGSKKLETQDLNQISDGMLSFVGFFAILKLLYMFYRQNKRLLRKERARISQLQAEKMSPHKPTAIIRKEIAQATTETTLRF